MLAATQFIAAPGPDAIEQLMNVTPSTENNDDGVTASEPLMAVVVAVDVDALGVADIVVVATPPLEAETVAKGVAETEAVAFSAPTIDDAA